MALFSGVAKHFIYYQRPANSDAFKTMEQIALENGFKTEKHTITTKDGYILNVWRIPGK